MSLGKAVPALASTGGILHSPAAMGATPLISLFLSLTLLSKKALDLARRDGGKDLVAENHEKVTISDIFYYFIFLI